MVLILQEIDGAKEIGMTTVRFISDPDCNVADFKVCICDDLTNLELSKVLPRKTQKDKWPTRGSICAVLCTKKISGCSLEDCF